MAKLVVDVVFNNPDVVNSQRFRVAPARMFRIETIDWLYVLAAIPLLLWYRQWVRRKQSRRIDVEIDPALQGYLSPARSRSMRVLSLTLWSMTSIGLILALANPQMGTMRESAELRALDVYIAVDVSESMLAEDVLPSRLGRARVSVIQLLEELGKDAKGVQVSLMTFAGQPNIESPLTDDFESLSRLVRGVSSDLASAPGTDLSQLLRLVRKTVTGDNGRRKVLIILSDGEEHEPKAASEAKALAKDGFQIFAIGVGTPEGARIPVERYEGVTVWKRDQNGREVMTALNEDVLKKLTKITDGGYFGINNIKDLSLLIIGDESFNRAGLTTRRFKDFDDLYRWPAGIGLLAWLVWLVMPKKRLKSRYIPRLFE